MKITILVDPGTPPRLQGAQAEAAACRIPEELLCLSRGALHLTESRFCEGARLFSMAPRDPFCARAWKQYGSRTLRESRLFVTRHDCSRWITTEDPIALPQESGASPQFSKSRGCS